MTCFRYNGECNTCYVVDISHVHPLIQSIKGEEALKIGACRTRGCSSRYGRFDLQSSFAENLNEEDMGDHYAPFIKTALSTDAF